MSAVALTPDPTPQTPPASGEKPSRAGRLLNLVRALIAYGKELAATVRHRAVSDPFANRVAFGTNSVAWIVSAIARALLRAAALEARLIRDAARLDAGRTPPATAPRSKPRAPRPPRAPVQSDADLRPICLPTPEQIAAEIRRRPIGAVIVDICLDLGINMRHPLWPEIRHAMLMFGGSLVRFVSGHFARSLRDHIPSAPAAPERQLPPDQPFQTPACTGPP